ncbi:MBL fold metallo-hydrolase [Psychroserpens sp.]|uniref:MBL fold metallo-hydrolase n=1 Tax=Psychroserpens sp. TaxID=2020870 RepID=UPI001AFFC696|nr:MBL fold metallo-hydrolase [Psychroserpens sp.]MBO6606602.1 MBL fold metallo-hydrolase [Psychroserpens sp.]MBO6632208.1 MBL fold metallo-hydrolase [Psychroserpens sp.]MBO6653306.1 MBL fold metallo-hydrolase [Psychroserpens sp.]MBO6680667.1 MBL fold metallo-hydrolase [Psychroserpens sp.]MBO6750375.1 MBL fold metallo-hydrolase [Psychroserpens sp.]
MKLTNLLLTCAIALIFSCKSETKDIALNSVLSQDKLQIHPISHATMVLETGETKIFIDPTGGARAFSEFGSPDIVLITDVHGDHFNLNTLSSLNLSKATVIAPKAVADKYPDDLEIGTKVILNNGDAIDLKGYTFKAVPMYNLREEALKFHTKGRGNGYILTINEERIYISGDTEDIPEMRALKDIDKAFVCMNLPWTMTVEHAADAVLEFKPKEVFPYHYRGKAGMSDTKAFKSLVHAENPDIKVTQLNWYPEKQ